MSQDSLGHFKLDSSFPTTLFIRAGDEVVLCITMNLIIILMKLWPRLCQLISKIDIATQLPLLCGLLQITVQSNIDIATQLLSCVAYKLFA